MDGKKVVDVVVDVEESSFRVTDVFRKGGERQIAGWDGPASNNSSITTGHGSGTTIGVYGQDIPFGRND